MKKLSFNIVVFNTVTNKNELKKVCGYQIDNIVAIYHGTSRWIVTDLQSGLSICNDKTKQLAIEKYQKIPKNIISRVHLSMAYQRHKSEFENLMKGEKLK